LVQPDAGLDTTAYVQLANKVLDGNWGLGPGVYYVSPLYIYFLAAGLALFKSFTAVRVLQVALGTASVGLIFLTARLWFGARAAWIAASLAALTGLFTFYEVLILQASIDAFLTSAALFALTRALVPDRPPNRLRQGDGGQEGGSGRAKGARVASAFRRTDLFIAGLIFGIQTLNRPNVLIAAMGVALVMLIVTRRVRPAALLVAGLIAGMAPAAIRNAVVAHQWSFVSSHGGLNFYIGNSPTATGFYQPVPGITPTIVGQEKDTRRVAARALGGPVSDAEASDYFFHLGRAWIAEHPGAALALLARKIGYVFHAQHIALPHSYPFYAYDAGTALRFYPVGAWLLTPLGLVGLMLAAPADRRREFLVWASFVPAYAVAVAAFFVAERYRLPLLVPLCAGAGAAIDRAMRAIAAHRPSRLVMPGLAFGVLFLLANWRVAASDGRWLEGMRLAEQLAIRQQYDEADRWASWLDIHGAPRPGAGRYGLGAQLLALNQPERALPYLEVAHRADPGNPSVDYSLGQALLKVGRAADAVPYLRRGFDAGIEIPGGGYDLAVALQATGDLAAAAETIRRINPSDKDDEQTWLRLGRLAAQVNAPVVAEPFFRRAVSMRPELAAARQQYGLNLLVLGRFDEAARELAEAVRLDPRDPDSLSHLAYCEAKLGRGAEARAHASAALALNPADPLARQLLAVLR
jgi:tetratricopeptide (TPR) repeat protein/4-amino-4-deoxy-L-arabinose transferase-like glycosyltransferase